MIYAKYVDKSLKTVDNLSQLWINRKKHVKKTECLIKAPLICRGCFYFSPYIWISLFLMEKLWINTPGFQVIYTQANGDNFCIAKPHICGIMANKNPHIVIISKKNTLIHFSTGPTIITNPYNL